MSNGPNDLKVLAPGHFLISKLSRDKPKFDSRSTLKNRLSMYQNLVKLKQHFRELWHIEYVNNLIPRCKRAVNRTKIVKDLIVFIKDENTRSMKWQLGKISDIYPGEYGIERVVTIRTSNGFLKRPSSKIAVLPISHNEESARINTKIKS